MGCVESQGVYCMEEYLTILEDVLQKENIVSDAFYLESYFQSISEYKIADILKDDDTWNNFFDTFQAQYNFNKFYVIHDLSMIDILKKLIFSILHVNEVDEKKKLLPLIIYLDVQNILAKFLLNKHFFDCLEEYFINTLESVALECSFSLSSNHWEAQAYNEYTKGIKEKNIQKIYQFVDAWERGLGQYILGKNSFINICTFVLSNISFNRLLDILNLKNDTLTIITLIAYLDSEVKLQLASQSTNKLLQFEALRQVVYFTCNHSLCKNLLKNENELVTQIIVKLSYDQEFWKQFIDFYLQYPLRAPQLFIPLGLALEQVDKDAVEVFIQTVQINQFYDEISETALNNCIFHIKDDDLQKEIMEKLFLRWLDFIDNYNDFFSGIFTTNIINIVISYIMHFQSKSDVIATMQKLFTNINEIDNKWFQDESTQQNYFYKHMSKLFVYAFAVKKFKLDNIKRKIETLCNSNLDLKYEYTHNKKSTLQFFNEHILQ